MIPCVFFALEAHRVRANPHLVIILTTWRVVNKAPCVTDNRAFAESLLELRQVRPAPHGRAMFVKHQPGFPFLPDQS